MFPGFSLSLNVFLDSMSYDCHDYVSLLQFNLILALPSHTLPCLAVLRNAKPRLTTPHLGVPRYIVVRDQATSKFAMRCR
jgi:hypothetical protein